MHYCYPAVLASAALSVGKLQVPMGSYHIIADKIKDIPYADVLHFETDFWKLLAEMAEPTFDSVLALKLTAFTYFTGKDENAVVMPS